MENRTHRRTDDLRIEGVAGRGDNRKILDAKAYTGTHDGAEVSHVGRVDQYHVVFVWVQSGFLFGEFANHHDVIFAGQIFEDAFVVGDEGDMGCFCDTFEARESLIPFLLRGNVNPLAKRGGGVEEVEGGLGSKAIGGGSVLVVFEHRYN